MATALGNARPRGRGRRGMTRLPGGGPSRRLSISKSALPGTGAAPAKMGDAIQQRSSATRGSGRGRRAGKAGGGAMALGGAGLAGPGGRQLAARVSSGAITNEQAQKTMQQRQTLAKAFGPNWRDKLKVGGKSFAQVRSGLAKNPDSARLAAINKKLAEARKKALTTAKEKNYTGKTGF